MRGSTRWARWLTEQAAHMQDEKKVSRRLCSTDVKGGHPGPVSRLGTDVSWDEEASGQEWNDGEVEQDKA